MSKKMYDLLLCGGRLVDPINDTDDLLDIAVTDGVVAEIGVGLRRAHAKAVIEVEGQVVMPGLVDPHVHLAYWFGCQAGFRMLARAGVTTAVDAAGPPDEVIRGIRERGAGVNIATLNTVWPTRTVPNNDPNNSEIDQFLDQSLERGAVGIKILGGHFPLTPEATSRVIERAARRDILVVFHAGTTRTPGTLEGLVEAVELADGNPVHLAHINAYCRGHKSGSAIDDAQRALRLLDENKNTTSDSYLFSRNGAPGLCVQGIPESRVTRGWLNRGAYEETEAGLSQAIMDGYAWVSCERNLENVFLQGDDARMAWIDSGTDVAVSFEANPYTSLLLLAIEKDNDSEFIVDMLCTDGGGVPRNVLVQNGIALVQIGALSLNEFIVKASVRPAELFDMSSKGHLSVGADGDITVIDFERRTPIYTIVGGDVVFEDGTVRGSNGRMLVSESAADTCRAEGIEYSCIC